MIPWVKHSGTALFVAVVIAVGTPAARAIIWHDDFAYDSQTGAAASHALATDYNAFPFLSSAATIYVSDGSGTARASGVLVGSQWILTAGHVLPDETISAEIHIGGEDYTVAPSSVVYHPNWLNPPGGLNPGQINAWQGWDLALIHLPEPVMGIQPAQLYTGNMELGEFVLMAGAGFIGTGTTPISEQSGTPEMHAAFNRIDRVLVQNENGYGGGMFATDFDSEYQGGDPDSFEDNPDNVFGYYGYPDEPVGGPSGTLDGIISDPDPFNLSGDIVEGSLAPGDSGGPAFIQDSEGNWWLAGIGEAGINPLTGNPFQGLYGSLSFFTLVSVHEAWILSIIPEPSSFHLLLAGMAAAFWLARRRRIVAAVYDRR